jgi:hypothetical protein
MLEIGAGHHVALGVEINLMRISPTGDYHDQKGCLKDLMAGRISQ